MLETMDIGEPGPGEIRISVRAAGINFPDVLVIAGKYQEKLEPPFVPGREVAGVVDAIGDGVDNVVVGDSVIAMAASGAFAESCIADAGQAMPVLAGMGFAQAAGFSITYGTSYHALKQSAALKPGERILVLGAAGGVGTTAIEIAKAMGAHVIAAASTDEKLEFARAAGADETINYSSTDINDAVKAMTDRKGVDVVYDPVGGELAQRALRALAWHGRYLVVGFASGDIPNFPANLALLKEGSIIGVWWGTWVARHPAEHVKNVREMAEMIAAGKLVPRVTERFTLDQYPDAFRSITERRAMGKVVLTMDPQ